MKRKVRAVIALILAVITAASLVTVAGAKVKTEEIPIVYVLGKVDVIYENKDGKADDKKNKTLYPVSLESEDGEDSMMTKLGGALKMYANAFMKQYYQEINDAFGAKLMPAATEEEQLAAWNEYGEELYKIIGSVYDKLALNSETGEPKDNSGICWDWDQNFRNLQDGLITEEEYRNNLYNEETGILQDTMDSFGNYGLYDYTFHYDWRLDMYHNAEHLNQYINDVLEATGKDKCVLISRCYGCNLVAAYFDEYGYDKVETNIIYCSTAEGTIVASEMFSGNFKLSPDGMAQFMDDALFGSSGIMKNALTGTLKDTIKGYLKGENFTTIAGIVNKIYDRVSDVVMPRTLINSFASMPGYWSLVSDNFYKNATPEDLAEGIDTYYEAARRYVFGDEADTTYKKMTQKIDAYHYAVTINARDIYRDMKEVHGINYANIVKYGTQLAPMVESARDYIGDGIVEVPSASFGATSVAADEHFDSAYLREAERKGTLIYIDPDSTIDASTCMYPDYTWFANGIDHFDFPASVDELLIDIARFDGQMTVMDNPKFSQFTKYDGEGNLITWAGGLYLQNSRDDMAKMLRDILAEIMSYFETVFKIAAYLPMLKDFFNR